MLTTSLFEVVSIGAVIPFLGAMTSPETIFENEVIKPLLSIAGTTDADELLVLVTLLFVSAAVIAGVMRMMLLWAQTLLSRSIGVDLGYKIYRNTLYQPYTKHVGRNSSEVISGITQKSGSVVNQTVFPLLLIASSGMSLIIMMLALIILNPIVSMIVILALIGSYGLIALYFKAKLFRNSEVISQLSNARIKVLQEGLGGIRDVLLDGTQDIYSQLYRNTEKPMQRAVAVNRFIGAAPRFIVEMVGMVLIAVLAYILVVGNSKGENLIPILGVLALGAQRILPLLQQGYSSWTNIRGASASLRDTVELLEQPLPPFALTNKSEILPFEQDIALKDISFKYPGTDSWVLSDVELILPKGARVGFIGSTGSGKSTLLDVIMGMLFPTSGRLCVDGVNIDENNIGAWQRHIAHVPQSVFLTDASITENIALGMPLKEIDHGRIRMAAKQAQIAETIESWDSKYDEVVGENGVRLSGGQRQRIGIARALYKHADVIILDEATSALDDQTENRVMNKLEEISKDVTVLMVAHRLSTLKKCDFIVELEKGKVKYVEDYKNVTNMDSV